MRITVFCSFALAPIACGDGSSATTAASSASAAVSSSSSAGGGGGGGAGAGASGGGAASSGSGGGCAHCAEWITDMSAADLCPGSQPLWDALDQCLCDQCAMDCAATCNLGGDDTSDCDACRSLAAQDPCKEPLDACTSDT